VITTKTDEQKRAVIPMAKPGQVYEAVENRDGSITLTPLNSEARVPKFLRMEKQGRYHVGILDGPLDEKLLEELRNEFP
jgi:hypothetical protein